MDKEILLDAYIKAYLLLVEALGKANDKEIKKEILILISKCQSNIEQAKLEIIYTSR